MLNIFLKLFCWQCNFVVFVQTFKILLTKVVYFWWEIFWRVITLVTIGMKMENFWPSCMTNEQRTSMLVYWSSGTESMVLTNGWIILEAKSVKSKVSENLSIVSNAALKYTVYVSHRFQQWSGGQRPVKTNSDQSLLPNFFNTIYIHVNIIILKFLGQ